MKRLAPPTLTEITRFLAEILDPDAMDDYGPNGLQVDAGGGRRGDSLVRRIVTGVTSNMALIQRAAELEADVIVVHHGLYWTGAPFTATGPLGRRLRSLLGSGISLIAYHLPLDGHPTLGNAAGLCGALELVDIAPAFIHKGRPAGCTARFQRPVSADTVEALLREAISDRSLLFRGGADLISTVGVVTGGAPRDLDAAAALGLDLFITGEAGEYSQATAAEEGIHFAACGHHRTERFGPMALADLLAGRFPGVDAQFVDIDNPA